MAVTYLLVISLWSLTAKERLGGCYRLSSRLRHFWGHLDHFLYPRRYKLFKRETFSNYPDDIYWAHEQKGDKTLDLLWNNLTEDLIANGDYSWEYSIINREQLRLILMVFCSRNCQRQWSEVSRNQDRRTSHCTRWLFDAGASYAILSAKTNFAQNQKPIIARILTLENTVKSIVSYLRQKIMKP